MWIDSIEEVLWASLYKDLRSRRVNLSPGPPVIKHNIGILVNGVNLTVYVMQLECVCQCVCVCVRVGILMPVSAEKRKVDKT